MTEIPLTPLRGHNPLGLFAALGALDVATRALPSRRVTLRWSEGVDPYAVLDGPDDVDHLVDLCWADVDRWRTSPVLSGPDGEAWDDIKVPIALVPTWFEQTTDPVDRRLLAALVTERAKAKGKDEAKPTHFHFTAGRQLFLVMARQLRDGLTPDHVREALVGPWESLSELPVFGWDAKGERIYALSGPSPAGVKKTGVPGADWLGLLGLRFFPVTLRTVNGEPELETTGCSRGWKSGSFAWPLWDRPISAPVAASLLGHQGLGGYTPEDRSALGISAWCTAPIRRSDQGGYGSFGAPVVETA
ncbi:MAG TPA: hypothetical protein VFU19_05930 [Iamia sp.]|nr:hypothetical protein [Iamia sp.]